MRLRPEVHLVVNWEQEARHYRGRSVVFAGLAVAGWALLLLSQLGVL